MKVHYFPDTDSWISGVISEILVDLPEGEEFSLVFSGGSTPAPVYRELCKYKVVWKYGHIFLADERFISSESELSNKKLVQESFLAPANFHFWETDREISHEECAEKYNQEIQKFFEKITESEKETHYSNLKTPVTSNEIRNSSQKNSKLKTQNLERPKFDIVLLGIGPDGHTASLFPHSPALSETEKFAITSETDFFDVKERLSMTYPALMNAKKIIFLMKGENKKSVLDELEKGTKSPEEFPAKKILEHENVHVCFGK